MRYVPDTGGVPAFLVKALGESAGELQRAFLGLHPRVLTTPGTGLDEGWCLQAIPFHLLQTESGFIRQINAMFERVEGDIPHVDVDDIPFKQDYEDTDEDEVLEQFHYLRRRLAGALWDLTDRDWERGGIHPYRGRLTLLELVREIYMHDLEHLLQTRRMIEAITGTRP